jgi:hypothetical protein
MYYSEHTHPECIDCRHHVGPPVADRPPVSVGCVHRAAYTLSDAISDAQKEKANTSTPIPDPPPTSSPPSDAVIDSILTLFGLPAGLTTTPQTPHKRPTNAPQTPHKRPTNAPQTPHKRPTNAPQTPHKRRPGRVAPKPQSQGVDNHHQQPLM